MSKRAPLRMIGRVLLGAWLAAAVAGADAHADTMAIVGATLIDGTGAPPIDDGVVVIEGERIAAVGRRDEIRLAPGTRVLDAGGKWIIPGLIDAHIHFFQSGGLYTRPDIIDLRAVRPFDEELAFIRERLPLTLARYLASGVTSVVDVGGPLWTFDLRDSARAALLVPRVAVTGPLLATRAPAAFASDDPPIVRVGSPDEARRLVRRLAARNPDLVKIWFVRTRLQNFAAELAWVAAAIDEAHAAGLRVAVHATELETARAVVRAGADVLVHSVEDRPVDDAFIRLLHERGVVYTTTLIVKEGYREVLGQHVRLSAIERRLGDPEVIDSLDDLAEIPASLRPVWLRRRPPRPTDPVMLANLERLMRAGVRVAAGSDAGNIGTLHGPALHRELELMAEAGIAPLAILSAATLGGAEVMGRAAELGTITPGKLADLVVLDADPLADITNTRAIWRVVKGGVVLIPDRILEAAEQDGAMR